MKVVALVVAGVLAGGAAIAQTPAPPQPPSPQPAQTEPSRPSFADWLAGVRAEAIGRGMRAEVVDEALATVEEPQPVILERDRTQAEIVLPLEQYVARRLTRKVLRTAREMFAEHRALLAEVGARYGVPPRIIVGIWGLESNFGKFSGVRPTIPALATLAWDPRRSTFFRGELLDALEILNRGDVDLVKLRGSWAGAMGQVQFMPSSYLKYAEDFDGDGHRDIWSSPADVFASIANYLKGHDWRSAEGWGRPVRVPPDAARKIASQVARRDGTCQATRDMTVRLPMADWARMGVRLANGRPLPKSGEAAMVSGAKTHYLVTSNYDALLDYNCAHSYAISVGLLADRIGSPSTASITKSRSTRRPHKKRSS